MDRIRRSDVALQLALKILEKATIAHNGAKDLGNKVGELYNGILEELPHEADDIPSKHKTK